MVAVAPSRGFQTYNAATPDTRGPKGTDESIMGPHRINVCLFGSKGDHDGTTWVQKGQIGQNLAKSSKIGQNQATSGKIRQNPQHENRAKSGKIRKAQRDIGQNKARQNQTNYNATTDLDVPWLAALPLRVPEWGRTAQTRAIPSAHICSAHVWPAPTSCGPY